MYEHRNSRQHRQKSLVGCQKNVLDSHVFLLSDVDLLPKKMSRATLSAQARPERNVSPGGPVEEDASNSAWSGRSAPLVDAEVNKIVVETTAAVRPSTISPTATYQ